MWKKLGLILAKIGGGALKGALWASQHEDVVAGVAAAVGHPEVGAAVAKANVAAGAIVDVVNTVKAGK